MEWSSNECNGYNRKKQRMNYPEWKESLHISHEALVYDEKVGSYWIKLEDMQWKSEYTD